MSIKTVFDFNVLRIQRSARQLVPGILSLDTLAN
jgi:hypothetical protein